MSKHEKDCLCLDCATEHAIGEAERAGSSFAAPAGSTPLPDIGNDPLKVRDTGDYAIASRERLSKGVALQQQGVPDQTMLAWRVDVSRILDDLTWRTASMKAGWSEVERLKAALTEITKLRISPKSRAVQIARNAIKA